MKKQAGIYLILLSFFSSTAFAGFSITEIDALIEAYGKKNIINFIREKSDTGSVTIEVDNNLIVKSGKPSIDHITAKSIQNDFMRLNISIEQARAGIVNAEDPLCQGSCHF